MSMCAALGGGCGAGVPGEPSGTIGSSSQAITAVPANLSAFAASSSKINLIWTANSSNDNNVVGYTFSYANNPSFTNPAYTWVAGRTTSSATQTGLSAGTTYWFKIKAEGVIDAYDSGYSGVVSRATFTHPAAVPTNLAAYVASPTQIDVTWTDNSAGNENVTGYTVATADNQWFNNASYDFVLGNNRTAYSKTGLSPSTTYWFKVKAEGTTDSDDSSLSGAVSLATPANTAAVPTNLAGTTPSGGRVDLTWTANSSGDTGVVGYTYAYATNGSFTDAKYVYVNGRATASTSVTGLASLTTYYFKLKAEGSNDSYDSAYTSAISKTTLANTAPVPSNLSANPVAGDRIDLSWTANSAGNADVVGYTYAYATNSSFTDAQYIYVAGNATASASRTGLSPSTTYYFKIKAEGRDDSYDSAFSGYISSTTPAATAAVPTNLLATTVSSSRIDLTWTANSSGDTNVIGYTYAYDTSSSFANAHYIWVAGRGTSSASQTGLSANTLYYFKIKAEGSTDPYDSSFSPTTSATTSDSPAVTGILVPSSGAYFGAWTPENSGDWGQSTVTAFEGVTRANRRIDVDHRFYSLTSARGYQWTGPHMASHVEFDWAGGRIPMVTWEPHSTSLDDLIAGTSDSVIDDRIGEMNAYAISYPGKKLFLRFAHEMNGSWYDWGNPHGGYSTNNTPTKYKNAWKHVVDRFRAGGVTNVVWVWCPNVTTEGASYAINDYYPGDDYVDWVCVDGYNRSFDGSGNPNRSIGAIVDPVYMYATTNGKPIMVGETSSTASGYKAAWITDSQNSLKASYPGVKAYVWFNENKEYDWRIISNTPASDTAYRSFGADAYFNPTMPW